MVEELRLPLIGGRVEAGFPSPADDFIERSLDLNEQLVANPIATFFVRASGNSMDEAGIHDGDLLIVDRSVPPMHGMVVVAVIDGGLTVKRLTKRGTQMSLTSEPNKFDQGSYAPIEVGEEADATIWGVVTWSVHRLKTTCTR
ncbi:MAG: translesion error-prone DNA polymerase V autoproteolytic subunit [Phycisphaerales bacterium]|jgi:DNA polymerase V|nr:translesion error-prone DNA polymerase V autoproteolytic subunit [Phycisphaerales bacterium]